jgi:hypothetical protein
MSHAGPLGPETPFSPHSHAMLSAWPTSGWRLHCSLNIQAAMLRIHGAPVKAQTCLQNSTANRKPVLVFYSQHSRTVPGQVLHNVAPQGGTRPAAACLQRVHQHVLQRGPAGTTHPWSLFCRLGIAPALLACHFHGLAAPG